MLHAIAVDDKWVLCTCNKVAKSTELTSLGKLDLCHMTSTFTYDLDIINGYHHTKFGDCRSNSCGDKIFCRVTFGPVSIFGQILIGDLDLCPMTLTFTYDLDINNGYHHTKFGDCRSNGSGDMNFCQVTFGPVWILVKSRQTDRHTDIQKVMHKSPLCIRTGGLKNVHSSSCVMMC